MPRARRRHKRKCLHCGQFFLPDPRTRDRQRHCSSPACRLASKAWRQRRWLSKEQNRDYFRGAANTARVQEWRKAHPGYWRRKGPEGEAALQDDCPSQPVDAQKDKPSLVDLALQDDWLLQPAVVVGLISIFTGYALQDDIASTLRRLHARGQSILGRGPGIEPRGATPDEEANLVRAPAAKGAGAVQLGGSAAGPA